MVLSYRQVKVVNPKQGVGLGVRGGALGLNSLWSRGLKEAFKVQIFQMFSNEVMLPV